MLNLLECVLNSVDFERGLKWRNWGTQNSLWQSIVGRIEMLQIWNTTHHLATWEVSHTFELHINTRHLEFNEDEAVSFLVIVHWKLLPLFKCETRNSVDLKLFADYRTVPGDFLPVNRIPIQFQAVLLSGLRLSHWGIRGQITVNALC